MTWIGPETAGTVEVPDVVGLEVPLARKVAWSSGVVLAAADPDGPPLGALTWPGVWVVTAQSLPPGSRMQRRGSLVVDFRPGGRDNESGDSEPRRPDPNPGALSAERDAQGPRNLRDVRSLQESPVVDDGLDSIVAEGA